MTRRLSPDLIENARVLWDQGLSMARIGARLGVSKNVIAGIAYRYNFTPRTSPLIDHNFYVLKDEHAPRAKLTNEIVAQVRREYVPRHPAFGGAAMARRLGVSAPTIMRAVRGATYR